MDFLRSAVQLAHRRDTDIRIVQRRNQGAVAVGAVGDRADVAVETKLAAGEQPQRLRVDAMLDAENALRQCPAVSSSATGTAPCITIGPASVSGMTKCTVAPEICTPACKRLAVRIEAGKRRQQRRMDVEHPAVPVLHEFGGEQPHESAEADQLDACARPALPAAPLRSLRDPCRTSCSRSRSVVDAVRACLSRARRHRPCSKSPATISAGKSAAFAASISAVMLEPRPEIRMATRALHRLIMRDRGDR